MTVAEDKQAAILNATMDLIAERGFHGTPMSQIAKRAGVSAGIIYHYFDGKDDLIGALYADIKRRWSAEIMADDPHKLPWPENFKHVWLNAYDFYVTHPKETLFLEQYENSPYATEAHDMNADENIQALFHMIEQHCKEGLMRPLPFLVMYEMTLGVAAGLAQRQILDTVDLDAATLDTVAGAVIEAVRSR